MTNKKDLKVVNEENLKAYHIPPKKRHLHTTDGIVPQCCVRLTISVFVFGATLGFCLLVAGGIGLTQLGNIKVLMYVGILMFLVCVILLVILCSSYDIFNIVPVLEQTSKQNRRFSYAHCEYKIQNDHLIFIDDHAAPYIFPQTCHHQLQPFQQSSIQNDVINPNRKVETMCTVKNCVCLLKNFDNRDNIFTIKADNENIYDVPCIVDNTNRDICCICHKMENHMENEGKYLSNEGNHLAYCHHQNTTRNGSSGIRNLSTIAEEFPLKRLKNDAEYFSNAEERTSKL